VQIHRQVQLRDEGRAQLPAMAHASGVGKGLARQAVPYEEKVPMKKLLILTAIIECLTGLVALVYPPILIRLLFGSEIAGAGVLISRIAGISLISLGVACWPDGNILRAFFGMITYNPLVALFLVWVGINDGGGILLWPVVVIHAGFAVLLVWAWRKEKEHREHT
jgi:hypothetical protein